MKTTKSIVIRYSEAFKHQVIKEVEEGRLTCFQAQKKYGIKSTGTIQYWIKRVGKLELLPKLYEWKSLMRNPELRISNARSGS